MENNQRNISLGFTEQKFKEGVHICQIFSNDQEREEILSKFLVSGQHECECTACFSDKESRKSLSNIFGKADIDLETIIKNGSFRYAGAGESYFQNSQFSPELMVKNLEGFYLSSNKQKFSGARVIGEMTPRIRAVSGGDRLFEYEAMVSVLQKKYPITAVCQYDAREFDGATIMEILKVHPYMIVRGSVLYNPYFIPPEDILEANKN